RSMIQEAVLSVFSPITSFNPKLPIHVVISIPDGEERAKKTLNQRLGIMGGLSILGTTGIVRPVSAKAWTDTIDAALDVARACGCANVVLSTGRTSEMAAQKYLSAAAGGVSLPEEAFIMMGDHFAHTLENCKQRGFIRPLIACQFAKLLKMACGNANTHAAASEIELATLLEWAKADGLPADIAKLITRANTAREIIAASEFDLRLLELVSRRVFQTVDRMVPKLQAQILVADYGGNIVYDSR
ncbi:MAG: cobalt-precorrin-5B (C(1))-methyltransferase, partial [Deltaproteobacteria bacterium]